MQLKPGNAPSGSHVPFIHWSGEQGSSHRSPVNSGLVQVHSVQSDVGVPPFKHCRLQTIEMQWPVNKKE